jgi:hypothetical protein
MDIVYFDKFPYQILEQKEILVWYTGLYRTISATGLSH